MYTRYFLGYVPLLDLWKKIIIQGFYSQTEIIEFYKKEKQTLLDEKTKKQKNLYLLMSNWRNLEKEDFKKFLQVVEKEFGDGKYLHPGDILHYASLMLFFNQNGILKIDEKDVISHVMELYEKLDIVPVYDWESIKFDYGGFSYITESETFEQIYNKMSEKNTNIMMKKSQIELNCYLNKPNLSVKKFFNMLNNDNRFCNIPVLSIIDIELFTKYLNSLNADDLNYAVQFLEQRYSIRDRRFYLLYKDDYHNLTEIVEMFKCDDSDLEYNPKKFFRKQIYERLYRLQNYFEKK